MESAIFVSGALQTGQDQHPPPVPAQQRTRRLRFAELASASFKNESTSAATKSANLTAPLHRRVRQEQDPAPARRAVRARLPQVRRPVRFRPADRQHRPGLMNLQAASTRAASPMKTACVTRAFEALSRTPSPTGARQP
jgi:hypothetical protein